MLHQVYAYAECSKLSIPDETEHTSYKKYKIDENLPIPRTTLFRHQNLEENDNDHDDTAHATSPTNPYPDHADSDMDMGPHAQVAENDAADLAGIENNTIGDLATNKSDVRQ